MINYVNDLELYVEKYGSDKVLSEYTSIYEPLFRSLRDNPITLLEVGIGTQLSDIPSSFIGNPRLYPHYKPGGSLRAWRDYFPNAQIYGIDVGEDCKFEEERIKTFIFSSLDEREVNINLKDLRFDIIVDDGLHTAEGQITTMKNLFNRVNEGGYYFIEDCGGGGDGKNVVVDEAEEFKKQADIHEWYFRGNIVIIRKNYSGKGRVDSFVEFFGEPYTQTYKKRDEDAKKLESKSDTLLETPITINSETSQINSFEQLKDQLRKFTGDQKQALLDFLSKPSSDVINKDLTVVTGLWNIGRPGRDFTHYIEHFKLFLEIPVNMFIFIPKEYEYLVWEKRSKENTVVKVYELDDIKNIYLPFWNKTQEIRTNPGWFNQTGEHGWLKSSPQAVLEWYNPIVQSKMFLLNDVTIWNPFNTEYFIWLDAGITNTVYDKFFTENRVLDKITPYLETFLFLSYPYEAVNEIHGFDFEAMNRYAGKKVEYVCRGGLFGGSKEIINQANALYYSLLEKSLNTGYMGTEESIFTLMSYLEPEKYRRYALDGSGLIGKFIQNLIDDNIELEPIPNNRVYIKPKNLDTSNLKTSLYMLTFNFPEQVRHTLETYKSNQPDFLNKTRKILIDNSNKPEAIEGNKQICNEYGFEHIVTGENLGINRGRLYAATHFQESDSDYYIFLEDDMGIHGPESTYCRNGFKHYIPNLYNIIHKIMLKEEYDFLKLSYTEVYMDNNIQVSWYNVPQHVRTEVWPHYDKLPFTGLDPDAPRTKFNKIDVLEGLSYIDGDIYYANWPMIVGKQGNQKMFLDTQWSYPYEQTWMSHMFQETHKGNIKPAVLLASPINHNRIIYYEAHERREN